MSDKFRCESNVIQTQSMSSWYQNISECLSFQDIGIECTDNSEEDIISLLPRDTVNDVTADIFEIEIPDGYDEADIIELLVKCAGYDFCTRSTMENEERRVSPEREYERVHRPETTVHRQNVASHIPRCRSFMTGHENDVEATCGCSRNASRSSAWNDVPPRPPVHWEKNFHMLRDQWSFVTLSNTKQSSYEKIYIPYSNEYPQPSEKQLHNCHRKSSRTIPGMNAKWTCSPNSENVKTVQNCTHYSETQPRLNNNKRHQFSLEDPCCFSGECIQEERCNVHHSLGCYEHSFSPQCDQEHTTSICRNIKSPPDICGCMNRPCANSCCRSETFHRTLMVTCTGTCHCSPERVECCGREKRQVQAEVRKMIPPPRQLEHRTTRKPASISKRESLKNRPPEMVEHYAIPESVKQPSIIRDNITSTTEAGSRIFHRVSSITSKTMDILIGGSVCERTSSHKMSRYNEYVKNEYEISTRRTLKAKSESNIDRSHYRSVSTIIESLESERRSRTVTSRTAQNNFLPEEDEAVRKLPTISTSRTSLTSAPYVSEVPISSSTSSIISSSYYDPQYSTSYESSIDSDFISSSTSGQSLSDVSYISQSSSQMSRTLLWSNESSIPKSSSKSSEGVESIASSSSIEIISEQGQMSEQSSNTEVSHPLDVQSRPLYTIESLSESSENPGDDGFVDGSDHMSALLKSSETSSVLDASTEVTHDIVSPQETDNKISISVSSAEKHSL